MKATLIRNMTMFLLLCFGLAALGPQAAGAATIYVNAAASGANNGSSWTDAYTDLQSALSAATSDDEIWVAAGTYKPSIEHGGTGSSRYKSFQMKNGVGIYGGFAGDETDRTQRDWVNNVTILSGDVGIQGNNDDNCYHVFYHPSSLALNSTAILDGVTITAGNAHGPSPHNRGGGMYNYDSSPILTNCTFANNSAISGGGIDNYTPSGPAPLLINCTFSGNSAGSGGGMHTNYSSSKLINCAFSDNSATYGGGMRISSSAPILINCTFSNNSADLNGGGMYSSAASPTLTNCTFAGNSATYGGGMFNTYYSSPTLINSILWGDTASTGNEIYNDDSSSPTVTYSDIQGGYSGTGNLNVNPLFMDSANGDFHLQADSPCIDAGNNAAPSLPTTDIDSDDRIMDGNHDGTTTVDMGVDEVPYIRYVDADASGAKTGTSWKDAYTKLQNALSAASSGDEIWVAAGKYTPSLEYGGTGDRYKSFQMKNGVGIYGGFAGGEANRNRRSWVNNTTILSGDIGVAGNDADNCYHVFYHPSSLALDSTAILDGFTITAGNADGSWPHNYGGGMYNHRSSPTLTNCTFSGNLAAHSGGGMGNTSSSPTLTNCTFANNSADWYSGGMDSYFSSPTLTNCTFSGNSATYEGGGIRTSHSSLTLINCTFSGNSTDHYGGGIGNASSSPTLTNCTFSGNSANIYGGGMYNTDSSPILANCIFWGNTASTRDEIYNTNNSSPAVTYCDIQGGYSGTGNLNANPLFVNATNGNFHLQASSPCIDAGNNAAPHLPATDFEGDDRIIDGDGNGIFIVDMGVDETKQPSSYLLWTK